MFDFPSTPSNGQEYAPSAAVTYVYNGISWVLKPAAAAAGGATISDAPPGSPSPGQFWWESDSGTLYLRYQDADSSQWVDVSGSSALANYLPLAGGSLTGFLTLHTDPTGTMHAATKSYVDTKVAAIPPTDLSPYALLAGATFTGTIYPKATTGGIGQAAGGLGTIEVRGNAAGDAAFLTFHRQGAFAAYFGLDTDNQLAYGGWSIGAGRRLLWDTNNFNPAAYAPVGGVGGGWNCGPLYASGGGYSVTGVSPTTGGVLGYAPGNAQYGFCGYSGGYGLYTLNHMYVGGATIYMPGLPTTAQAAAMHVSNPETNRLYRFNSSAANKTQIEPIEDEYGDKILDLKPVFFRSLNEVDDPTWSFFGFTAEDADAVDFRFCMYTKRQATDDKGEPLFEQTPLPEIQEDGTIIEVMGNNKSPIYTDELVPDAYNINGIVAALVQLVQRQDATIKSLTARVDALEGV